MNFEKTCYNYSKAVGELTMKYDISNIYPQEFEKIVKGICCEILGITVQLFSGGKDGGRDAKYEGSATLLNLNGKFIIQAKHTTNPIAKFSDLDFLENQSSIINKEIPKIKKLIQDGELDHYLLFSNRRLSASAEENVRNAIVLGTGLPSASILLFGQELIDDYLKEYPNIPEKYDVEFFYSPLRIVPDDLAEVITSFFDHRSELSQSPRGSTYDFKHPGLDKKNQINGLSKEYFQHIQKTSFGYFDDINEFLTSPINEKFKKYYEETVDDLQAEIISNNTESHNFDEMLSQLYKHLIQVDTDLKKNKALTRAFLYYMYCNCDIGMKERNA